MIVVMLICVINNRDVVTMCISKFKMVAHTVVEEHGPENKSMRQFIV